MKIRWIKRRRCLLIVLIICAVVALHLGMRAHQVRGHASVQQILRPIHFIVNSNESQWPRLTACAVLSAARHHPERQVFVHSTSLLSYDSLWHNQRNIHIVPLDVQKHLQWANLTEFNKQRDAPYWISNLSNALRYVLLYRFGGIYLDTDVITLRPFSSALTEGTAVVTEQPARCIGNEKTKKVNNAVLSAPPGSSLYGKLLQVFIEKFDPEVWGCTGPRLVTELLLNPNSKWPLIYSTGEDAHPSNSDAVTVLPCNSFFKFGYKKAKNLFVRDPNKVSPLLDGLSSSFGIHVWRAVLQTDAYIDRQQVIGQLMNEHCPGLFSGPFADRFLIGGQVRVKRVMQSTDLPIVS